MTFKRYDGIGVTVCNFLEQNQDSVPKNMKCVGVVKWFGVTLLLIIVSHKASALCRWTNEGCEDDSDCCSQSCEQAHRGADKRCSAAEVNFPCYADYMCGEGLACGKKYKCCVPYWQICDNAAECCDSDHVCRHHSGFNYKRCLYRPVATATALKADVVIFIIFAFISRIVV